MPTHISGEMIGGIAALLAVGIAVLEWRNNRLQRVQELRHRQALLARECIKDAFSDKRSRLALTMLDWFKTTGVDEDGAEHTVTREEVKNALRVHNLTFTAKERFVRNCFERLYDHLEQIENSIQAGVIRFEDVETSFRYYLRESRRPDLEHTAFLDRYDYPKAKAFVLRYNLPQIAKDV